jgi:UDP-2,3-diacylglucosamine hydrolase
MTQTPFMKKTFFASDFHLGTPGATSSQDRERLIVKWLESNMAEMETLYLVGDVWDYWFEYGKVIPKGYTRLLGTLARIRDANIPIYYFTGNHDMWMFRYLQDELDIPILREPVIHEIHGKKFYIGHGDGLGPGDYGYKFIKKVFASPVSQWLFARLHPNTGIQLMKYWSGRSRQHTQVEEKFLGLKRNGWSIMPWIFSKKNPLIISFLDTGICLSIMPSVSIMPGISTSGLAILQFLCGV